MIFAFVYAFRCSTQCVPIILIVQKPTLKYNMPSYHLKNLLEATLCVRKGKNI